MKKVGFLVLLFFVSVSFVYAQSDIGLKSIGGKIGFVMPEAIDNTFGFGVVADLGTITPTIALQAHVEYWGKTYTEGYNEWSWSEIMIGATAKYYLPSSSEQFKLYGGAGLDLVIGSWDSKNTGHSASDTDIGIHACVGAEMPFSPSLTGLAELKYNINGFADYFAIFAGAKFALGK